MWAHHLWVDRFYPTGKKPGTELALYAQSCTAVEGITDIEALPTETAQRPPRSRTAAGVVWVFQFMI